MKKSFLLILFVSFGFLYGAFGQQYFNHIVSIPKNLPPGVAECVDDMVYWLSESTGKKFNITTNSAKESGIQLLWADETDRSAGELKELKKDGQSFYLYIKENTCASIIGSGSNSFINGIYTFLHELGFRWYMPGDVWTVVPKEFPKKINISRVYTPDFRDRTYAGTGGMNRIEGTDPNNDFKKDFITWNRRNRFNTDYMVKAHAGQVFYRENKKELDDCPSCFCSNKVNRYGRIDISSRKAVELFVSWSLKQVKSGDRFPTIGVDPADGAGGKDDCLPANMPEIKTWSDKYFWLANKVAEQLDKSDTKTQVQLYAYANHAEPPGFKLDDNVYPVIIPYAFQRITTPENFINLWSKKMNKRPIGMYDYWNITQWSRGLPQFNIYSIPEKLRLWKKYNVTAINIESTNGKGAMGHAFWLASQMMWNTSLSFDSLYNDFLTTCFGAAAPDVKRMYDRWSKNYQQLMDVDLSLNDLKLASSKTNDKIVQARLSELKAYVHFIKLFYDYQANATAKNYEELVAHIHSIHHLRLVQSSALLNIYIKPPKGYVALANKTFSAPKQMQKTSADIQKEFQHSLAGHKNVYKISGFEFDIKKATPLINEKISNPKYLNGRNNYRFYQNDKKTFSIQVGSASATRLVITDEQGKIWLEKEIAASKDGYTEVRVLLPEGIYTLSFGDFARFSRIKFPPDKVFVASGIPYYDNAGFPLHYIYVPKDVDAVVYEDKLGPGINKAGFWLDPDGERVDPVKLRNTIYKIPVPEQYRGKVWALRMGHRSFQLLNIPNVFSIRKFDYSGN